jgi:hypothetical protein
LGGWQIAISAVCRNSKGCFVNGEEKKALDEIDRMLTWFHFDHLPAHLQLVSQPFAELALTICARVEPGPERTVSLRKLLEAKDAAVRAKIKPGG